jgi:hypothetical protein
MKTPNSGLTLTSVAVYFMLAFLALVLLTSNRRLSQLMEDCGTAISGALGL